MQYRNVTGKKFRQSTLHGMKSGINFNKCYSILIRKDMREMIKAGIIGSTGYAGAELVRILMGHKDAEIVWYGSRS